MGATDIIILVGNTTARGKILLLVGTYYYSWENSTIRGKYYYSWENTTIYKYSETRGKMSYKNIEDH